MMATATTMERAYKRKLFDQRRSGVQKNAMQRNYNQAIAQMRADEERKMAQEAYLEQTASAIGASRIAAQQPVRSVQTQQSRQPRTDAQVQRALEAERQAQTQQRGRTLSPLQERELKKQAKIIANYERMNWTMLYAAACIDDMVDFVPIPGMSFLPSLYITVKLRRIGPVEKQNSSLGWRIVLMIIDMIPIINLTPISIGIVYNARESERKRVAKARAYVKKYGQDTE